MAGADPRGGLRIDMDGASLSASMRVLKQASPDMYKRVRAVMRTEATKIKNAQARAVRGLNPVGSGGSRSVAGAVARQASATSGIRGRERANHGLRDAVARGLKVEYRERATARRPFLGIRVRMSGAAMPAGQGRLPKHMNYGRWRHPVFGNRDAWSETAMAPKGWFDGTFAGMRANAFRAIAAAIDDGWRSAGLLKR